MTKHMTFDTATLTISTLAADAAQTTGTKIDAARLQGTRIHRLEYIIDWRAKTVDDGPLFIGFHRASISAAEVAEFYLADPQSSLDVPAIDQARFDVYPAQMIPRKATAGPGLTNDAIVDWKVLNWPWKNLPEDDALNVHAFNAGNGAFTTGAFVDVHLKIIEEFDAQ